MAGRQSVGSQYFIFSCDRPFEDKSEPKMYELDPLALSLRRIMQTVPQTNEEKFKILEERDKLYKIMKEKDPSLKKGALIATCPDMCPEKERLLRDSQGRGSMFEMSNHSKTSTFNHCLAVKEYARSSADQEEPLPHDLRPINVLMMTMSHLLHNVVDYCELSDDNLEEWYMFMWDRTRALRKELTQQRLCSLESVTLVEQCARFHIHCAERLVDQDSSIYDDKINTENLTKCLQTLKYMYKDLAKEEIKCENEPEFICYSLLLNLNNSSVFTELSDMSNTLMTSKPVKFALDVMTTWETRNYIRFFNLVKKTTYLNCCLLRRYFGEMRLYAIKTMIRSYCTKTYSPQILISRFVQMLNFDGEVECFNFLSFCNFNFVEIDGRTAVNFDRIHFQNPNSTISSGRAFLFIEEKKQRPLSIIMAGGTEPPVLYKDCIQQNSFTASGELDPEIQPQKELVDFFLKGYLPLKAGGYTTAEEGDLKNDYSKSTSLTADAFSKPGSVDSSEESKLQKTEEAAAFSHGASFSFKKENVHSSSVFGAAQTFGKVSESTNVFGKMNPGTNATGNVFNATGENNFSKNIFGNQGSSNSFNFNRNLFGNFNEKTFPAFCAQEKQTDSPISNANNFLMNSQAKVDVEAKIKEEKEMREKLEKEKLERERIEREKEEESRRKREEEEKLRIFMEKKMEEENRRRELERRERERREEEERRKREELARREKEERDRREEEARRQREREANAKHLAELKRQEEIKRRIEMEHKRKVERKMKDLKSKMRKWKTKIVFDKWRMKTWTTIEGRKMREYLKEVKVKYPPVCTEEMLNGNPYGLLIPSVLTLEKFRNWKKESNQELSKKILIISDELPLLKVDSILGKILEERARSLECKLDPFTWKLVISVPDKLESEYSKSIETFVEMHFVEDSQWRFGFQKGPLYCRTSSRGTFRFTVSIRRLRGCKLFEGVEPNPSAMTGSNALIFLEDGSESACDRLKAVLKSRRPFPKIPVIVFPLNGNSDKGLAKLLELESSMQSHISKIYVASVKHDKPNLVAELIKCLCLAVAHSAPPSSLRVTKFSKFFSELWFDSIWRRVEIGLSNYKIILQEPKILIEFYNSCLEKLSQVFLDKKTHAQQTVLAPEFSDCDSNSPAITFDFEEKLKKLLNELKLPHWPAETPKSCHQLNYRIHQYCKKVFNENKLKTKNLKWLLYRIIRQSLLWKGLDIYCDEDINKILTSFPWILVFQEVSRVVARQVIQKLKGSEDLIVTYDVDEIDKFSFESSFISKFFKKSKVLSPKKLSATAGEDEEEFDDLSPRLEKDSIVYAYTAAIERETNKRKREECYEESLDALFSSPAGKRVTVDEELTDFDVAKIETNIGNLDSRLNEMKKQIRENFETLTNIYKELQ